MLPRSSCFWPQEEIPQEQPQFNPELDTHAQIMKMEGGGMTDTKTQDFHKLCAT